MTNLLIADLSTKLKTIAKDLSFLARPHFPRHELKQLFPEHQSFIDQLEDSTHPYSIDIDEKKKSIDRFIDGLRSVEISSGLKEIFLQRALDYGAILRMLETFGTSHFYKESVGLYGSSLAENSDEAFLKFMSELPKNFTPDKSETSLEEGEARAYLRDRLLETFPEREFEVKASNSLLSDSSAGRRALKLNPNKKHSTAQLEIFLVHEGWVHLGTSINGSYQKDNPWLSSWAPRTTYLQEGQAILTEIITANMTFERWLKIRLRHEAVKLAEKGSSIIEVYHFLLDHKFEKIDALKLSLRVFRGVPLDGGMAFTKELLYLQGLRHLLCHLNVLNANLSSLWFGKMSFEEHRYLYENQDNLNLALTYFPHGLKNPSVLARLESLKELAGIFFKGDIR